MSSPIWLDAPNVGELEKQYLCQAIDSGFVSTIGPFVPRFEQTVAAWLSASGCSATQSGTAALHVALMELGVGEGDEVIVPALTFVATANPVMYLRARPVFVDADPDTFNLDVASVERAISPKTKAIVPVHLLGNPVDMHGLMAVARARGVPVVEDATESLGASVGGRSTATIGDLGCLSFNGNKTITTGGGGMVVGSDAERLAHIRFVVNQARDESRGYYHPEVGLNYRMTNLEAALGLAQMERLDTFLEQKRAFRAVYEDELGRVPGLRLQREAPGARSAWWLNAVVFERDDIEVAALQKRLLDQGIQTRRMFVPITDFPPYAPFASGDYPVARRLYERGLCLPSSTLNTVDDVRFVCHALKALL
jgi:perosamine synthetase